MKVDFRHSKLFVAVLLLFVTLGTLTGVAGADGHGSIVDVAAEDGRFTTLLAAAEAAGVAPLLDGPGEFTLFAPTDDAFAALPEGTVEALLADTGTLKQILLYHVLQAEVPAEVAVTVDSACTALGKNIGLAVVDGALILNGGAQVIITDVEASNGIIHVIDAVLLPPDGPFDCSGPAGTTSDGVGGGADAGGDAGAPPSGDFDSGTPRVELEIDADGGKETVAIAPPLVPFDGLQFSGIAAAVVDFAREGRGALGALGGGDQSGCDAFESNYLTIVSAPKWIDVPAEANEMVGIYESGIQKIADGARNFFLYCFNGGGFSSLNYSLAITAYEEGNNFLERAAGAAADAYGTPEAPVAPPPPAAEEPEEPEDPPADMPEDPDMPPAEEPPAEEPAPPADGGADRPPELAELFPGAELYFGNNYPLASARVTLFLDNGSGTNEAVDFPVNVVPFNGDNFTTVAVWSTTFVDIVRTDILPGMSGGSTSDCDLFVSAFIIVLHSPQFSDIPGQYQPWVDQYNNGVNQFLNGTKDLMQWCVNGGNFPSIAYQPAVDAANGAFNTLRPVAESALEEFGVPPALEEAFGFAPIASATLVPADVLYAFPSLMPAATPAYAGAGLIH